MACLLLDLGPGDEVIVPSFTFTSTANVVATRGATPVFVDVESDTLNVLATGVSAAITARTKAVIIVHYAGTPCNIDAIKEICDPLGIPIIEDAAHALGSLYKSRPIGSISPISCFSFHETKNIQCGEGGALLLRDESLINRACVIRDKGTNRADYERGAIDRYRWVGTGGGYRIPEVSAAVLNAQLEELEEITANRISSWNKYFEALRPAEKAGFLTLPRRSAESSHNAHIFHVILRRPELRSTLLGALADEKIIATSHYTALHDSPAGVKYGRTASERGRLANAAWADRAIVRLPLWFGMTWEPEFVAERLSTHLSTLIDTETSAPEYTGTQGLSRTTAA